MNKFELSLLQQAARDYAFIISNNAQIWPTRELVKNDGGVIKGRVSGWTVQIFVEGKCIQPTKPTLPEAVQAAREELCRVK